MSFFIGVGDFVFWVILSLGDIATLPWMIGFCGELKENIYKSSLYNRWPMWPSQICPPSKVVVAAAAAVVVDVAAAVVVDVVAAAGDPSTTKKNKCVA